MLLLKFLILFFALPALRFISFIIFLQSLNERRNIFLLSAAAFHGIACCVTPLYVPFSKQQLRSYKRVIKYLTALLLISFISFISVKANAQTTDTVYADSNYVDTISMHHINPLVDSAPDIHTADDTTTVISYDDQDDGYVDTTVKHIYDTSKYFFNTKNYYDDLFKKEKTAQRHLIDADVNSLKHEDDFWYIPAIEKIETRLKNDPKFRDSLLNAHNKDLTDDNQNSLLYQLWFNTLLWIIIIGIFTAAVIYILVQNKIGIFSKEAVSSTDETSEEGQDDIFSLSYTKLIQNAEKEKSYRVAVRLMFLQTLKLLSDTSAIKYQPDYTDMDYLQQLSQSKYYSSFFNVMRNYEYVWYGKFAISPERYASIKNDFIKLQHKIT